VLALGLAGGGCTESGPSTEAEVCQAYDDLSAALLDTNGFFDNAVFHRAGDLGGLAARFEGDSSVRADGQALKAIADGDETSGAELEDASRNVASLCGAPPLTVNSILGGD
jgi:hypothetical protein